MCPAHACQACRAYATAGYFPAGASLRLAKRTFIGTYLRYVCRCAAAATGRIRRAVTASRCPSPFPTTWTTSATTYRPLAATAAMTQAPPPLQLPPPRPRHSWTRCSACSPSHSALAVRRRLLRPARKEACLILQLERRCQCQCWSALQSRHPTASKRALSHSAASRLGVSRNTETSKGPQCHSPPAAPNAWSTSAWRKKAAAPQRFSNDK